MTNLLTTPRQPWLTRGRLLVGLPLGIGVVVSAAVGLAAVRPLVQSLQGLEERRDILLSLQRSLLVVSHDDLVSVSVDVTLHEWDGFVEDVEACSD